MILLDQLCESLYLSCNNENAIVTLVSDNGRFDIAEHRFSRTVPIDRNFSEKRGVENGEVG